MEEPQGKARVPLGLLGQAGLTQLVMGQEQSKWTKWTGCVCMEDSVWAAGLCSRIETAILCVPRMQTTSQLCGPVGQISWISGLWNLDF